LPVAQNPLLPLPASGDNAAVQTDPPEAEPVKREGRWSPLTVDRLLLSLLAVEVFIVSCASLGWFGFHKDRVWTVWFALTALAGAALLAVIRSRLRGQRWYQFSLRSLLLFTLICAIASAWLAHRMDQKRIELEAVDSLVKRGARVAFDYHFLKSGGFDATAQPPGPAWLRRLVGENFFGEVENVEFPAEIRSPIVDADLVRLGSLTNLKSLELRNTEIGDAGLANLEGMTRLRALDLSETRVTDAGLVHLKRLTTLTWLDLRRTNVTDAGRAELERALPNCLLQR
jgi:hypothetical protein